MITRGDRLIAAVMPRRHRMKTAVSSGIPLCVGFMTLLAFATLNLDGYQIHLVFWDSSSREWRGPGDFNGEPPFNNWAHGWPFAFVVRSSVFQPTPNVQAIDEIPWTSRWPVDDAKAIAFNRWLLGADCAIAALIAFLTYRGARSFCARYNLRFRYRLSSLFVIMTVSAIAISFRNSLLTSRYPLQIGAASIVCVSSVIATLVILASVFRMLMHAQRKAEPSVAPKAEI
tara:strand:- start:720 stop:1406 length:687 start_codon:yes stop_codon:yes gene_type:complete